jgi:hypothetical protein
MIRKSERPFNFTDRQIAQLKQIHPRLRTLNRNAICELRRIGWTTLTDAQYRDIGKSLETLSIRINNFLRARQGILSAGQNQQPQLIEIVIGSICDKCDGLRARDGDDNGEAASREALQQDPAYQEELEILLDLLLKTDEDVTRRSRRAPPRPFFLGLKSMTEAVQRQQRHFRMTTIAQRPSIKVLEMPNDVCDRCGEPTKDVEWENSPDTDLQSNHPN